MRSRLFQHLVVALAGVAPSLAQERPPAPVTACLVESREVMQRERVTGSLRAASEAVLAALEEGAVTAFPLREGEAVHAGDTLAVIDARRLEAARVGVVASRAEAGAIHAQRLAEAQDAREDLASLESAAKSDAISQREVRRARTALVVAEAQLQAAAMRLEALDAELALLDVRLVDSTLRAPFDGVVVERHVEVGEWVKAGDPMLTLVSAGALEVWLDVPERMLGQLAGLGNELTVELGAERVPHRAVAPRVVPRVDPSTRTFALVATLAPSLESQGAASQGAGAHGAAQSVAEGLAQGLSPGVSASAWLSIGRRDEALMVPKDALVYRPGGVAVMVIMGDSKEGPTVAGTAALVPVVVRFEAEREVALEPGAVQAGALVVTEGNERLFPGTPVLATVDRTPR